MAYFFTFISHLKVYSYLIFKITFLTVQTAFAYSSAQGVVGVGPSFFAAVFFEDFRFDQLVMQIVEIVLYFAVGQLAVDQVAEVVVVIAAAVVGFQAVVGDGRAVVVGQDIVRGVEGEHFITRLGNPAQFVVFEPGRSRPLVGACRSGCRYGRSRSCV